jgi:hypothetical protein
MDVWDVGSGTQKDNHINFYNKYLLLLEEEHTDELQVECAVTSEALRGPEKGRNSKAGCA